MPVSPWRATRARWGFVHFGPAATGGPGSGGVRAPNPIRVSRSGSAAPLGGGRPAAGGSHHAKRTYSKFTGWRLMPMAGVEVGAGAAEPLGRRMKPDDASGLDHPAPLLQVWARPAQGEGRFEELAEETPVALAMNGISQAVMMATPADLEDFALGFALTEGWIDRPSQLLDIDVQVHAAGVALDLRTTARCDQRRRAQRRAFAGRTGCGLCGVESLAQLQGQGLATVTSAPVCVELDGETLAHAARHLGAAQALHARCGGLHAAAWCDRRGQLQQVREDVGRHNALDKLIGALLRSGAAPDEGFVLMSSRCSFELVHKVAAAGIGTLACVSAPTAHAVRSAAACGVARWGFVRDGRATRYGG